MSRKLDKQIHIWDNKGYNSFELFFPKTVQAFFYKEILRKIIVGQNDNVLDIGTFDLSKSLYLFKINKGKNPRFYCTDIGGNNIEYGKELVKKLNISKNFRFKKTALEKIDYPENFFDIIICFDVIEHTTNFIKSMKNVIRIAKPNSQIYFSFPLQDNTYSFLFFLKKISNNSVKIIHESVGHDPGNLPELKNILPEIIKDCQEIRVTYFNAFLPHIFDLFILPLIKMVMLKVNSGLSERTAMTCLPQESTIPKYFFKPIIFSDRIFNKVKIGNNIIIKIIK